MKVLVVVFAAIYLVSAVPTAKKIIFNEDDSISLIDQTMRQITIAKPMGMMEGRFLDVVVNAPTIPRKSIVLDVEAKVYGPAQEQMRLLYTILMPFRNEYVTEEMYGDILRQVKMVVDEGRLSPIVCATLKALTHDELFQKLIVGEGIFAREARIMGVPVTGDIINKIHETKMYPTTGLWYPTTKYTTPHDMKYFGGYTKSMGLYTPEFLRTNVPEYMRTNVPEYMRTNVPEFMRTNLPEHMRINVPEYMRTNVLGHMRINTPEYMGVYAPQHMGLYQNAGLYNALYNTEPMGVWNMLNLGRQYERSTPSMMSMMNKMMMMHEYPQMTYRQDYYGTTPYLGLRQIMGQIYDRPMTVGNQYPLFFGKTTQVY